MYNGTLPTGFFFFCLTNLKEGIVNIILGSDDNSYLYIEGDEHKNTTWHSNLYSQTRQNSLRYKNSP